MQIETVAMPAPTKPAKIRQEKKLKVKDSIRQAAKEYKAIYKETYGADIRITFDGTWIRLQGEAQGMTLKRLKERTTQLRNRKG